jgi:hypothetical protein
LYILDLVRKCQLKFNSLEKVHNKIQIKKGKKPLKDIRKTTRYKETKILKECKTK